MHISLVTVKRVFYTGTKYLPYHIGAEAELGADESPMDAFDMLNHFIDNAFAQKFKGTPYADQDKAPEEGQLPEIQVKNPESLAKERNETIRSIIADIHKCKSVSELSKLQIFLKTYPEIIEELKFKGTQLGAK